MGQKFRSFLRLAFQAWHRFSQDNCPLLAAALSFYGLVSFIPLCFLGLWGLSWWLGPEDAYRVVTGLIHQHIPHAAGVIIHQIDAVREGSVQWVMGSLWGIVVLVWSGTSFYETLARILTVAWARRPLRPYWRRKLLGFLALLTAGLFLFTSVLITTTLTALQMTLQDFPWVWKTTATALPLFFSIGMFFLVYKFLPNTRVPTTLAFRTAFVVGIIWENGKTWFARFVASRETYQHLYGSLTGVVILMLWIYFSALLLLLGAELAAAYHLDGEKQKGEG